MNIIINRSDAIGDTILTSPVAECLKEYFPACKVIFIVSGKCRDLFLHHPFIDEVWVLEGNTSWWGRLWFLLKKFKALRAQAYFHVGGGHLPSLVAWLVRVAFRGGLVSKWQTFLFLNHGLRQKRSMVEMHETEYNLELLQPFLEVRAGDINPAPKKNHFFPILQLGPNEANLHFDGFKQDLMLAQVQLFKEIVVIHPGMVGHTLNWNPRNYAKFVWQMNQAWPRRFTFVVSFTPSDKKFIDGFKQQLQQPEYQELSSRLFFMDGAEKGIRHYMALLSKCALFLGPSTGPTHMANAMGAKVIGIYSPIKVQSSFRWGPNPRSDERVKVAVPDVVCGERFRCAGEVCPYHECMAKIEVDQIKRLAEELLPKI